MTIHKRDTSTLFSTIYNEGVHSEKLSLQAKGLLWFLLTSPNDLKIEELRELNPESFDAALEELRLACYVFNWSSYRYQFEVFESQGEGKEWFIDNCDRMAEYLKQERGAS